jgi:hypothetical protein
MKLKKPSKKTSIFLTTILVLICILSVGAGAGFFTNTEIVTEEVIRYITPEQHLFVETTYLLKTNESNHTVDVTCTPYLTNTWLEDSGEIKIIVYVVDKNNIAEYKKEIFVGKIKGNTTFEIEVPIVLTKNSTKVDMLIFENNKLQLKGQATIRASQTPIYVNGSLVRQKWVLSNDGVDFYQVEH